MSDIGSLVHQPMSGQMPQQQGSSGAQPHVPSLTDLLRPGGAGPAPPAGGAPGAAPQPPQGAGGPPAPDHHQTAAALRHLGEFDKHWSTLLSDPEIGTKNMRPAIYDMMADVMGEGLVTLPQVMNQMKTLPTDPLQQKQWIAQHYQKGQAAMAQIVQQHAAAFPAIRDWRTESAARGATDKPHTDVMGALVNHYRARTPQPMGRR